ncbi:MAG: hypothetical protein L6R39_000886 [Caloplaca ligustica]|nr:MAG: hypothetical protein L6R39_000886 [Caloplaca ligustica]
MTRLQSLGRTNLEHLHQKENSMDPCNRCHAALDHHEDPGWVFIPTDLNFFIDFERTDYRRRVASFKKSSDGVCTQRIPPTPDQYVQACGGLYDMYMLRPFGSPQDAWQHPGRSAYQPNPKVWHGDPMLALFKAFHAVESNPHLLPEDSLMTLSRLYRANDEIPRLDGAIGDSSDDDDDSGDDNSDAGQDDADNPAVPPNSKRDNKGTSRGRGRGRGRGQANVLPSASGGARGKGRGYKTSAAPPAPERDTEDPSPPTGKIRGKGRGNGRGNGSASRAARNNCQEHKGLQDKDLEDKRWEGFKRRLEESQELVVSKRPKVEVSPFKWGPDQTSNAHVEDFKAHNAHMEACGYMMSWDKQEAESTEASKKVLQKGTKDEIKEELKDKIKVMGLLSPPATEDRILGGVGRGHRRLNVRLD